MLSGPRKFPIRLHTASSHLAWTNSFQSDYSGEKTASTPMPHPRYPTHRNCERVHPHNLHVSRVVPSISPWKHSKNPKVDPKPNIISIHDLSSSSAEKKKIIVNHLFGLFYVFNILCYTDMWT